MKTVTYGRSPVEIAEDWVISMCGRVFNVSREYAVRYKEQRIEIAPEIRAKAEKLLDEWEGTEEQCEAAYRMYLPWCHATRYTRLNV